MKLAILTMELNNHRIVLPLKALEGKFANNRRLERGGRRKFAMHIPFVIAVAGSVFVAAARAEPQDVPRDTAGLIRQLSAGEFDQRQAAMRDLTDAGLPAIPALTQAMRDSDPETRWRAASVLERIGLQGDERTLRKVTRIMHLLGESGIAGLGEKCQQMRELWLESQAQKITAQLSDLGATVEDSGEFGAALDGARFGMRRMVILPANEMPNRPEIAGSKDSERVSPDALPAQSLDLESIQESIDQILADSDEEDETAMSELKIESPAADSASDETVELDELVWSDGDPVDQTKFRNVTIDANWRGTDRDWGLLSRVSRLALLTLSSRKLNAEQWSAVGDVASLRLVVLDQCEYEVEEAFQFRERRPDVNVRVVGRGFLGVMGPLDGTSTDCVISQVVPGTGAEKAGLTADDEIVSIDGKSIRTFQDLVLVVGSHEPGEEIELEFRREGDLKTTTAVLQKRNQFDR